MLTQKHNRNREPQLSGLDIFNEMGLITLLKMTVLTVLITVCTSGMTWALPPQCNNPSLEFNADYTYIIGSSDFSDPDSDPESGSTFRWIVNSSTFSSGEVSELLSLTLDNSLTGHNGETPSQSAGVAYETGKWGSALALDEQTGSLKYQREGNFSVDEGTIEMWVALRADGSDAVYSNSNHILFDYWSSDGDYMRIVQSTTGVIFAGGKVDGQWQSAYNGNTTTRSWLAGQWHHVAYTFSAADNYMRFYVDGVLKADTNEDHYWPPTPDGLNISIGGDKWNNNTAHYYIDSLRISGHAATSEEIAARAGRLYQMQANEIWLGLSQVTSGDVLEFEFTPSDGIETGTPCLSMPVTYQGVPVYDPDPRSTLLAAGTEELTLSVKTLVDSTCGYALGDPLAFIEMSPFDQGANTTVHTTLISGLDTDPNMVNEVYVRCASDPDFLMHLRYRVLSGVNPSYPRTGNLWGSWQFNFDNDKNRMANIDLWLGAGFNSEQIRELRELNPDIRILTSINAVENPGLEGKPEFDDFFLKDINGNPIPIWLSNGIPSHRMNLTKPEVAEYQAYYAYQRILDSDMMFDGVMFDNVFTSQAGLTKDVYGNPVVVDYDEDGLPDDPDEFNAAWRAGVLHEFEVFRSLMPDAVVTNHGVNVNDNEISKYFNGRSYGFRTADVIEEKYLIKTYLPDFREFLDEYNSWFEVTNPYATMIESSPPDQIAYGYGYTPWNSGIIRPSTMEFAKTYYPYMRFGLAFTLMNDGFFAHEFGDIWHGNDWWYDELDHDLGYPRGAAYFLDTGQGSPNIITNGDFEAPIVYPWTLWANASAGCAAYFGSYTEPDGSTSVLIDITSTSGQNWHIDFAQKERSLIKDAEYNLEFRAKSDVPRSIYVRSQQGVSPYAQYGLSKSVNIDTEWEEYIVPFTANTTADDARIQFQVGEQTGQVWIDDVRVFIRPPDILGREFDNGLVLLNASRETQTVDIGPGYRRLVGDQASRYEYILDDSDSSFSSTGNWTVAQYDKPDYDNGRWYSDTGYYYHNWGKSCYETDEVGAEAAWALYIPEGDMYTIEAWWPTPPVSVIPAPWSEDVVYEIVAGGQIIASASFNQNTPTDLVHSYDEWHWIGEVYLEPDDGAYVRIKNNDPVNNRFVADAIHVRSAARYNNGMPTEEISLQPMDGVVLARFTDLDNDGYSTEGWMNGTDCNDNDSAVNPGHAEICDGKDNNCDGITDEGFDDTDSDGIKDCIDPDDDNDGLSDSDEVNVHSTDPLNPDTDNDGLNDGVEVQIFANPLHPDTDWDGILDGQDSAPLDIFSPQAEGYKLSKNSNFSTWDAEFSTTDTFYIIVWSNKATAQPMKKKEYKIKNTSGEVHKEQLGIEGPNVYSENVSLSAFSAGAYSVEIWLRDWSNTDYKSTVEINVQ